MVKVQLSQKCVNEKIQQCDLKLDYLLFTKAEPGVTKLKG